MEQAFKEQIAKKFVDLYLDTSAIEAAMYLKDVGVGVDQAKELAPFVQKEFEIRGVPVQ